MSALSSMCRTAILILVLAAGLPVLAFGQQAPVQARAASPHKAFSRTHARRRSLRARRRARARRSLYAERRAAALRSSHRAAAYRASLHRASYSRALSGIAADRASNPLIPRDESAARREPLSEHDVIARETAARRVEATLQSIPDAKTREAEPEDASSRGGRESDRRTQEMPGAILGEGAAPATSDESPAFHSAETSDAGRQDRLPFSLPVSLDIRRGAMPPPLRGSLALLERQDERLEADGLKQITNEADLSAYISHHLLVPLPVLDGLTVNPQLPLHHRFCRPWTARFLADLAIAHEAVFHRPLEVSSAVRTVAYQEHLMRINGNAAPAFGAIFSPHLMGATIDIAKKQMSVAEIAWMRRNLLALELAGKIDVEEEFEQACFHITVYKNYLPAAEHLRQARGIAAPAANESGIALNSDGQ